LDESYYSANEVESILGAYRRLVPTIDAPLRRYWDLDHERDWSCLVSDFENIGAGQLAGFHQALAQAPTSWTSPVEHGEWLRGTSREHGVGFSLGISPWTDDLILRTFQEATREVVLVVGHDWYPIVNPAYTPRSPLVRFSLLDEAIYARAVPVTRALEAGIGLLFINLYPDFRPPCDETTGKMPIKYGPYVDGLLALCSAAGQNFRLRGVVSWGGPVWEALQMRLGRDLRSGLWYMVQQVQSRRTPLSLPVADGVVPYYPFLHPSSYLKPRFADPEHVEAYQAAWDSLLAR
jgi:hypothetical protein